MIHSTSSRYHQAFSDNLVKKSEFSRAQMIKNRPVMHRFQFVASFLSFEEYYYQRTSEFSTLLSQPCGITKENALPIEIQPGSEDTDFTGNLCRMPLYIGKSSF